jgi:hypothetical protein
MLLKTLNGSSILKKGIKTLKESRCEKADKEVETCMSDRNYSLYAGST